jgi:uncharacterized membrane protein YfcA
MSALIHDLPSLCYGLVVGVSLGLTGGGGSIFAVPLLIYGLGIPVRSSIGLSLAVVGATAGFGAMLRLKAREVDVRSGIVFALGGMGFAPVGTWVGHSIPSSVILSCFAILMTFVGWRMWMGKADAAGEVGPCVIRGNGKPGPGCYTRLAGAGAAAGLLSGLFGVGGGFIIVPALLYVTGTTIHRAVATSLLVIFLISLSGVAANLVSGQVFPMPVSVLFLAGGLLGMVAGGAVRSKLSGPALRKVFAIAMWLVGAYMLLQNLTPFLPKR